MLSRALRQWPSAVAIGLALAVPAQAQQAAPAAPDPSAPPRYAMPFTHMWDMTSDSGEIYRIFVSYPNEEAPAEGYPVLYLLDGNAIFGSFAEARRLFEYQKLGNMIVVGVGYPTDMAYDQRRAPDYMFPIPDLGPARQPQLRPKGDARARFFDFLTGKLRTEIGKRYKIDLERQSLYGHSFGGHFALHALYTRPEAFHSIVAASPALGWNSQELLREERDFTARLATGKPVKMSRLMVVVGGRDTDDDPEPARALASRLDLLSGYGMNTRYRRYDEEIHITVPSRSVTEALRFVLGPR